MADNNLQATLDAINDLINADGTIELPGLELKPVAENYVDTKYGADLAAIEDPEEREEMRQKWIKYYTEGEGKDMLQLEITNIKAKFGAAKDQLKSVGDAVTAQVASNAIPSVLTVGAASSTPNPAYTVLENKSKVEQLKSILKQIGTFLVDMLKSMAMIAFAVPAAVLALIQTLKTTKQAVNTIPV